MVSALFELSVNYGIAEFLLPFCCHNFIVLLSLEILYSVVQNLMGNIAPCYPERVSINSNHFHVPKYSITPLFVTGLCI